MQTGSSLPLFFSFWLCHFLFVICFCGGCAEVALSFLRLPWRRNLTSLSLIPLLTPRDVLCTTHKKKPQKTKKAMVVCLISHCSCYKMTTLAPTMRSYRRDRFEAFWMVKITTSSDIESSDNTERRCYDLFSVCLFETHSDWQLKNTDSFESLRLSSSFLAKMRDTTASKMFMAATVSTRLSSYSCCHRITHLPFKEGC